MEIQLVMRLERDGGDFEWGVGGVSVPCCKNIVVAF